MPFKNEERKREYHKNYLKSWRKNNSNKYKVYMKNYRQKNSDKLKIQNSKAWEKVKANRPKKICLGCNNEFSGRLNKIYCSNNCRDRARNAKRNNVSNNKYLSMFKEKELEKLNRKRNITSAPIAYEKLLDSVASDKDTTYSSIWLTAALKPSFFKDKISEQGFSEFNPFIAKSIISFWSNVGDTILDPFAGRTRGIISSIMNRRYIGFEISPQVYSSVKEEFARLNINPELYNEDSNNIDKKEIKADMVLSCPPYWNLEKYESCPGQLSDIEDYNLFLEKLKEIIGKSCDKLKSGGYAAFVVGDFRRSGVYIPFHLDFINLCKSLQINLHDIIILQNIRFGVALRRFGSHKHVKTTGKCHEYLLIFKKR